MPVSTVLLKTPLHAYTGYGNDGFALTRAFAQFGLDVRLSPTSVEPPLPMGVATMLVKAPEPDYNYMVHHIDPMSLGLTDGLKRLTAKKIAWSMWEFTKLAPEIAETMTERLEGYDLLVAYDEVSAEAFEPHATEAGVSMKVLQGGYWSEDWKTEKLTLRDPYDETFRFIMAGQLHQRKNPYAAINAFNRLRAEGLDVELHLKTNIRFLHPAMEERYPGLKIFYDSWSHEQMREFYAGAHCYVAPSWGEGKNLPALESATMGVPSIYSDFGGHRQWGSSEWGWPIKGTLACHDGLDMPSFRVDEDALYEAMKEAATNRSLTQEKGRMASMLIPAQCDWMNVIRRFMDLVG